VLKTKSNYFKSPNRTKNECMIFEVEIRILYALK